MSPKDWTPSKPSRKRVKAIILVFGPTGAGKTTGALNIGAGLGSRICLINSETYGAQFVEGVAFDEIHWPDLFTLADGTILYNPEDLEDCLRKVDLQGYDVVVVDNLNLWQEESGGWYEQKAELDKQNPKKQQLNWGAVNEAQRRLMQIIKNMRAHVILTSQAKPRMVIQGNSAAQDGYDARVREKISEEVLLTIFVDKNHKAQYAKLKPQRTPPAIPAEGLTKGYGEALLQFLQSYSADEFANDTQRRDEDYLTVQEVATDDEKGLTILYCDNEVVILKGIHALPLTGPYKVKAVLGQKYKTPTDYQGRKLDTFPAEKVEVV